MRCLLTFLVLTLLLAGCSERSFIGGRVDDFSAYYNTFYNAREAFDEGVSAFEVVEAPIDETVYLPLFPTRAQGSAGAEAFERAIDKSADVLREHPTSRWVDDALMLIGKSYYYLQNHVGAAQKFNEVMVRGGPLEEEARFWLARALIAAGRDDEAAAHLEESLREVEASSRWAPRLHLARGALHVEQEAWPEAAAALEQGLDGLRGGALAARARFLLGQVYETMERYDAAAQAYGRAAAEHPRYELAYAAQVAAIRAWGRAGRVQRALEAFQRMERDDKHAGKQAELALLRGRLYQVQGRIAEARAAYQALLGDAEAVPEEVRGRAHYALGTLYRDAHDDLVRAAEHFEAAATLLETGAGPSDETIRRTPTPVAVTDSRAQAARFSWLAEASRRVERLDSLLHLAGLDDAAFQAFVAEVRRQRLQEQAVAQQARRQQAALQQFAAGSEGLEEDPVPAGTSSPETQEAGFLFHRDPMRVQQGRANFRRVWGGRPHVPNWRRLSAISGQVSATTRGEPAREAGVGAREVAVTTDAAASVVDVSAVPRDPQRRAAMRAERTEAYYELGNALFLSLGRPDSAATWYRRVIDEGGDAPVAWRARYALAETHRARGQREAARRLYRQIIEQRPASALAARARQRLQGEVASEVPGGALAQAERAYEQAYTLWQQSRYDEALVRLVETAARHQAAEVAPRALLAAGRAALEWAERAGFSPWSALPVAMPDSLFQEGGLFDVDSTTTASPRGAGVPGVLRAEVLFASIMAHYPQTPYAAHARRVLEAFEERRPAPVAGDSSVAGPDTLARRLPSTAEAAGARLEGDPAPPDTARVAAAALTEPPADTAAWREGEWTLVVASEAERAGAEAVADRFRRQGLHEEGYPVRLLRGPSEGGMWFRVAVGQFATLEEARRALRRFEGRLPEDTWLLALPPERN